MNVINNINAGSEQSQRSNSASATSSSSHDVCLYENIPTCEMNLDQFEVVALKRLRVLRKVEQVESNQRVIYPERKKKIKEVLDKEFGGGMLQKNGNNSEDVISHFILRLVYCENEDKRRWFLQQETVLLRYRLDMQLKSTSQNSNQFASFVPNLQSISIDKLKKRQRDLFDCLSKVLTGQDLSDNVIQGGTGTVYMIPFEQALELVAQRRCYVHAGLAYIGHSQLVTIVGQQFRSNLSQELNYLASKGAVHSLRINTGFDETSRVFPLLKTMHECMAQQEPDHEITGGDSALRLSSTNIPQFKKYMPLCARQLQTGLERDGKLKHWGRMQYGLFLKGAGLSMEDALLYFQRAFSTTTTQEKFQKEYVYSIRHMYGKEGRRKSYSPYNCNKIINGTAPNGGEHHGCPFKHYDSNNLNTLLQKLNIGTLVERQSMVQKAKSGHYQIACLEHFQVMHPKAISDDRVNLDNVGNHPNAWFRASVEYHNKDGIVENDD